MTRGFTPPPVQRPPFERAVLRAIQYRDHAKDWEKAAVTGLTDDALLELTLTLADRTPFKIDGSLCRFEEIRGKACLWYDGRCLGGPWLLDRIREIVGIA